jgi:mRNA export factor
MDSAGMLLAAATSEGKVHVVDLNNPTVCRTATKTALHKQIRVVSCFPTGDGYAVGGIEGRCAFVYLNPEKARFESMSLVIQCFCVCWVG